MVAPNDVTKAKTARYLSILLILALAAAGTFWLRGRLVEGEVDLDKQVQKAMTDEPTQTAVESESSEGAIEASRAQPKLQWRTVDGGVQLVQSEAARTRWESERERIYQGLREQKGTLAANTFDAGPGGPKPGTLGKEYIQNAINELKPLFKECYELALHDDERVKGKLTVAFTIAGDSQAGIVESAEIADGATAKHDGLRECMRETIYSLDLPAPKNGGVIHVRYPFEFENTPSKSDAGT